MEKTVSSMERERHNGKPLRLLFVLSACLLSACGTLQKDRAPRGGIDPSSIPDAVPKVEQRSRYGNPDFYEVNGERYYVLEDHRGYVERGTASWYGEKFHGRRTSSGEIYDMYAMTAAHRTLPLPTYVEVTNLDNGRSVVVKVNDRGPFHGNRLIDLSYAAAAKLDMLRKGTAPVEVRALDPAAPAPRTTTDGSRPVSPSATPAVTAHSTTGAPPIPVGGRFYVQTGAFSDLRNAETLRSTLSNKGTEEVHIVESSTMDGRVLYKVRIGPLANQESALRLKDRLASAGITAPHVVVE